MGGVGDRGSGEVVDGEGGGIGLGIAVREARSETELSVADVVATQSTASVPCSPRGAAMRWTDQAGDAEAEEASWILPGDEVVCRSLLQGRRLAGGGGVVLSR